MAIPNLQHNLLEIMGNSNAQDNLLDVMGTPNPHRNLLERMFKAAIEAAQPKHCIPNHLPENKKGRLIVIGAGKASAEMARVVEDHWEGELSGLVVTRYGHGAACKKIEIIEAAHPVPDASGITAAKRIHALVSDLSSDDTVLCLISGGGSALLALPLEGITLEHKQALGKALLASGANIGEINCVRRHLSAIKGGRLAAACHPAKLITLLISDVPGDHLYNIASGPTVGDPTTCADALEILKRYGIEVPLRISEILESGLGESIKPEDPRLQGSSARIIASSQMALDAAAKLAMSEGVRPYILGDSMEGEAKDVAKVMAAMVHQTLQHGQPFETPCVLISGGETTVKVHGKGRGGRNVEFLLSLGISLDGLDGVYALAGDTDGVDGLEEIAGAYLGPNTLKRAWKQGLLPKICLDNNDAHGFFKALGNSIFTGPTLTNVNDFRAILILGNSAK